MTRVIAALGDRDPAFLTHREIDAAIGLAPPGVEIHWLPSEGARLDGFDGVWVSPVLRRHAVRAAGRLVVAKRPAPLLAALVAAVRAG